MMLELSGRQKVRPSLTSNGVPNALLQSESDEQLMMKSRLTNAKYLMLMDFFGLYIYDLPVEFVGFCQQKIL